MPAGWIVVALAAVAALAIVWRSRQVVVVQAWQVGLLYEDGVFRRVLSPGRYGFWGDRRRRHLAMLNTGYDMQSVPGVDVMSADRFSYRLGLTAMVTLKDPRHAYENAYAQRLALAAREALALEAAALSLDDMLRTFGDLGERVQARLVDKLPDLEIHWLILQQPQLPPETRRMVTEVERVRLEGLAALERARAEHAALRSLANAARLLQGNPELMNLRLLQAVDAKGGKGATLVLGDGALSRLRPGEQA